MLTEKMIKVYEETREFKALCSITKEWYTIQQHIEIFKCGYKYYHYYDGKLEAILDNMEGIDE